MKTSLFSNIIYTFITCVIISSFTSCKNKYEKEEEKLKKELLEKYNCESVDDCLSKYQFEGARKAAAEGLDFSKDENMKKIVVAETAFWINEKDYDRAFKIVKEFKTEGFGNDEFELQYNTLNDIISELITTGDFEKAKLFALKASDKHNIEGWKKEDTNDWDEKETQQKLLLKKINDAENILKKNK